MCKATSLQLFSKSQKFILMLIGFLLAFAPSSSVSAQIYNYAPVAKSSDSFVSFSALNTPDKAVQQFESGLKRLNKRDWEGSLQLFDRAIAQFPQYYEAYYHKGIAENQLHEYEAALQSFQSAIDLSGGKYPRAEFGYGLVLCKQGRAAEAERVIRHGLQTDPTIADGYVVLALALLRLNRLEEAEHVARARLLMRDSERGKGYIVLADIHAALGNVRARIDDLNAYLKLNPGSPNSDFLRSARDFAIQVARRMEPRN